MWGKEGLLIAQAVGSWAHFLCNHQVSAVITISFVVERQDASSVYT